MAATPYHQTLKELTEAQKLTNENLLKIDESIKAQKPSGEDDLSSVNENLLKINESIQSQLLGVRDAIAEPPPKDIEAISEKKAADKGLLSMLKGMFGGKKKDGDDGVGGITKLIEKYKKIVKGIIIAVGIGVVALLSCLLYTSPSPRD